MENTPKGKAIRLIEKYQQIELLSDFDGMDDSLAIECAIIAVDLKLNEGMWQGDNYNRKNNEPYSVLTKKYWQEVKSELEKLKKD